MKKIVLLAALAALFAVNTSFADNGPDASIANFNCRPAGPLTFQAVQHSDILPTAPALHHMPEYTYGTQQTRFSPCTVPLAVVNSVNRVPWAISPIKIVTFITDSEPGLISFA